nr:alanine racemase [uncultured Acetatifactor sp.]
MDGFDGKTEGCQRGYAEVNLDNIVENMQLMKRNLREQTQMMAVVKADGYGHGSVPVARCLERLDFVYGFGVATAEEAHILRLSGIRKPILILGYAFPYSYEMLAREEIRPAVFREDSVEELERAATAVGKRIKVHVKVDTGMGRIGVTPDEEGIGFIQRLIDKEHVELEGIFTHFAKADERDKTSAHRQLAIFEDFLKELSRLGIAIRVKHCSNSAGILDMPEANMDVVRAGIAIYGLYPSKEVNQDAVCLKPALSLYSRIVYIKTIHPGQSVSYGSDFTAKEDTRVATVPLGYGDGYPRSLSGRGYVLIRGKKAPILGRICMDQFMVDVSQIPEAAEGDRVTLIGGDGARRISTEELGELSGRFHYELVCDLGKRVPRVYVQNGGLAGILGIIPEYAK